MEDNRLDTFVTLDEFEHLDPEFLERSAVDTFEKQYRPISVRPLEELRQEARQLDFFQHKVIEMGIKHARALVKARHPKNPLPIAPLLMVDGAAGSGKSKVKDFLLCIMAACSKYHI